MLRNDAPFKPRKLPRPSPPEVSQKSPYFAAEGPTVIRVCNLTSTPLAILVLANHEKLRTDTAVAARRSTARTHPTQRAGAA